MTLRDAIKAKHDEAEKHPFVVLLLSGKIPPQVYADYLFNQALCYRALETTAQQHGLLDQLSELCRADLIEQDALELRHSGQVFASTQAYVEYVGTVTSRQLWAHIYARHFADLYGGQMIKKVAPGACRMYEFEDRSALITKVRAHLDLDLADEANRVFDFALALFDEVLGADYIRAA